MEVERARDSAGGKSDQKDDSSADPEAEKPLPSAAPIAATESEVTHAAAQIAATESEIPEASAPIAATESEAPEPAKREE